MHILMFYYGILQWIWRGGVNLKCIDAYGVLEWANDTKFHVFATKHKANTYNEQLIHSDDCVSIQSWPPIKFMTSYETQE
jgi:hypothetical protein